jgi:DIS3-like exonuclease 2
VSHIGEAGDLKAESLRILKMHDVYSDEYETQDQPLNEKVHESLRVFTKDLDKMTGEWRIPEEEIKQRLDLRKKRIFTIDPLTAKDLDDALSIDKISDDLYEIGVHIADVSYFVQQGTELDREA